MLDPGLVRADCAPGPGEDRERDDRRLRVCYICYICYIDYLWYFAIIRLHLCAYLLIGWLAHAIYSITASTSGLPGTWW